MPEFQFGSIVPFPRDEVFDFVTDPRTWPGQWPQVDAVEDVLGWDKPGGTCRVRLAGGREHVVELLELDRPRRMRDVARLPGLPEVEHERVFAEVPEGTWLQNYARYDPRPGLSGLLDRTVLAWWIGRRYERRFRSAAAAVADRMAARVDP